MLLFALLQAVDVWSFGIVLYELWALREPYDGLNYHTPSSCCHALNPVVVLHPTALITLSSTSKTRRPLSAASVAF
jgi:hypothetical protein